jgi:hypothetical protein
MPKYTYTDINLSLLKSPSTLDIVKRYDVEAVKSSVRNILMTNSGEKLFKPDFGANLYNLLFELMTPATKMLARRQIVEEIQKWEPRVDVTNVDISMTNDARGELIITVDFYVRADSPIEASVTVNLTRVR